MEQQLAAGLGERQVAEFVEDDEVHPDQMFGDTTLPPGRSSQIVSRIQTGRSKLLALRRAEYNLR